MAKKKRKKRSKYEKRIKVDATPDELAQSLFWRKPKPKDEWACLKRNPTG